MNVSEVELDELMVGTSQLAAVLDISGKYVAELTRAAVL